METLADWTTHENPGVRHFSGTARYLTDFTLSPAHLAKGGQVILDLGDVREVAEVTVNGRNLGIALEATEPHRHHRRRPPRRKPTRYRGHQPLEQPHRGRSEIPGQAAGHPHQPERQIQGQFPLAAVRTARPGEPAVSGHDQHPDRAVTGSVAAASRFAASAPPKPAIGCWCGRWQPSCSSHRRCHL